MDFEFYETTPTTSPSGRKETLFPKWIKWAVLLFAIYFIFSKINYVPVDPDIDVEGKYALIVEEASTEGRMKLSESQLDIFRSVEVREAAEALVSKIEGAPGFFVIDAQADLQYMPDIFQTMLTKAKEESKIPGIVIVNDGRGSTFYLPEGPERTIQLLKENLK